MAYIVTDACVRCKYTDCVEVCPVDCFYQGEHMLVINPDECIDCGVCEPECPVNAIASDATGAPDLAVWLERNRVLSKIWPRITQSQTAPPDAELYRDQTNKFERFVAMTASSSDEDNQ